MYNVGKSTEGESETVNRLWMQNCKKYRQNYMEKSRINFVAFVTEPNIKGIKADNENINWNKIEKLYVCSTNSLQNSYSFATLETYHSGF